MEISKIKNHKKHLRALIIGGGSMGQKHLVGLIKCDIKDVGVVDSDASKLRDVGNKYNVVGFRNISDALEQSWDMALICTPPESHVRIALKLINKKIPVFIEKPLSHNLRDVGALVRKVKINNIPLMIGFNGRFHPQAKKIKELLRKRILGKIWHIRIEYGQYLPDWHPGSDYRRSYSAQKKFGGGIVLDDIHDIDLLMWLFGRITKISGVTEKLSNLQIDVEDWASIIVWFKKGVIGEMQVDYLQRELTKVVKIIGENGTILWDVVRGELKCFTVKTKRWKQFKFRKWNLQQTYFNEIAHFVDCVKKRRQPDIDVDSGSETLRIALAAKKSARLQKVINI